MSRTNDKARHQLPVHDPAAVDAGLDELPREALDQIASVGSDELIKMHLIVGSHLRNTLGLWAGNPDLLNACGKPHPDDASLIIFTALWEMLQEKRDGIEDGI